jgi:uncharacterized membrane protein YqjE
MNTEAPPHAETQSPLRRLAGGLLGMLQTRLELIGIEMAEEKERLLFSLFIGLAGMLFSLMALITLTALVAAAFWDTYRWQSLAVLAALYAVAALVCALKARASLHHAPPIFPATLAELEKDRAALKRSL